MSRTIGRIVTVLNFHANGSMEQPGIVTRVWGPDDGDLVNVTVFPDCAPVPAVTQGSIPLFSDRYRAEEWVGKHPGQRACFFPTGE